MNQRDQPQPFVGPPLTTPSGKLERRRSARGGYTEPARPHVVRLILGTYAEMPGLSLHVHQAARLFGLSDATCEVVMSDLVRDGQLRRAADGQYRRVDSGGA